MCDICSDEALRIFGVVPEKKKRRRVLGLISTDSKTRRRDEKRARKQESQRRWLKNRLRMEAKIRRPCRHHKVLLWDKDGRLGPETRPDGGWDWLRAYNLASNR